MKYILLLIAVINLLTINCIFGQEESLVDLRYKGGELSLRKYIANNIMYPVESQSNNSTGYAIAGITITPEGKIDKIETINFVDAHIEEHLFEILKGTKNMWIKSETDSTNRTFYLQILFSLAEKYGETIEIENPVSSKFNFIEPIVVYALRLNPIKSDDLLAAMCGKAINMENYENAMVYISELIERNPFNKNYYQLRIHISRKLNDDALIMKDINKINNFIEGVSLDDLVTNQKN